MGKNELEKSWGVLCKTMALLLCLGRAFSDPLSEEGLALLAMKASFADPMNHLENWKLNGTATPCLWSGIACNNMSSVIGLYWAHMNLTGTLSADLGRLKNLEKISIEFNNFTGMVPVEVSTLLKLQYLNISNNNFNGGLPAKISMLQSLQVRCRQIKHIFRVETVLSDWLKAKRPELGVTTFFLLHFSLFSYRRI